MKAPPSINGFLARYFPVFMGTIFMAIFSGSASVSMAGVTYLRGLDPALKANYSVGAILVLFPLLGLLLLNSKRHREMRQKLLEIRRLKEAVIAKHKAR